VGLSVKQKAFVDEYLIDLNATQAAIRAGYSVKTADRIGPELLGKTCVAEQIQKRMRDREKRTEITQDRVLKELADIAFDDIKNYLDFRPEKSVVDHDPITGKPIYDYRVIVDIKDSKEINTKNISEISIGRDGQFKFKLYCKDTALVQVGKHLGMFTDKTEISGSLLVNNPLQGLTTEDLKKLIKDD